MHMPSSDKSEKNKYTEMTSEKVFIVLCLEILQGKGKKINRQFDAYDFEEEVFKNLEKKRTVDDVVLIDVKEVP